MENLDNLVDENDIAEGQDEAPYDQTVYETEPEEFDYNNYYENSLNQGQVEPNDSIEEAYQEEANSETGTQGEADGDQEMDEPITEEPIEDQMQDQLDVGTGFDENQSYETDQIEERTNKGPIVLAIGTPRNPFHFYAYEQYN